MSAADDDLLLLTGDEAGELLAAALRAEDGELRTWQARSVDVRPDGCTVSYRATAVFADGSERTLWLGASTRALPGAAPDAVAPLELSDGARTVRVWLWPRDPWLPALPLACDPAAVGGLLVSLGAAPAPVRLQVRAYRPGRRAVLQGRSSSGGVFVKVLRPQHALALHSRHRLLAEAGLPVPHSAGFDQRGLVVLEALPGTDLRERLRTGGPVPAGEALLDLLDRLPAAALDLPARASWSDSADHYAAAVGAALTSAGLASAARWAGRLGAAVEEGLAGTDRGLQPVHGDLYEAQLLLDAGGGVCGLLDLDGVGPGRRADDLACLLAHLEVLAALEPAHAERTRTLRRTWQSVFEQSVDPVELRLRTAGVLLSLATGPYRVQEAGWEQATCRRLSLVQGWLAAAGRVRPRARSSA